MTEREIEEKAIKVYGEQHQVDMCIEEMAELTKALLKGRRYSKEEEIITDNIYEEIADVKIMLKQLEIIYGNRDEVQGYKWAKLDRLAERLGMTNE